MVWLNDQGLRRGTLENLWKGVQGERCTSRPFQMRRVKVFVYHVNAHQRVTSSEDTFCDTSLLSVSSITQPLVIAKWAHEHSGCSSSEGNYAWAQQSGLSLNKTDLAKVTVKRLIYQQQRPKINLAPFPGWISLAMLQVDCIRLFSSQNGTVSCTFRQRYLPCTSICLPCLQCICQNQHQQIYRICKYHVNTML